MSQDNDSHVHIVPPKILLGVFAALIFLTFVTVAVTWVDLGKLNLVVALGVATVKATLVALYFMHLRWDRPFNGVVFLVAIFCVFLFITMALLDTTQYQPTLEQGSATGMR
jgi:cytochrome c oxidase subunit IV